jgi:hypothetical protein
MVYEFREIVCHCPLAERPPGNFLQSLMLRVRPRVPGEWHLASSVKAVFFFLPGCFTSVRGRRIRP